MSAPTIFVVSYSFLLCHSDNYLQTIDQSDCFIFPGVQLSYTTKCTDITASFCFSKQLFVAFSWLWFVKSLYSSYLNCIIRINIKMKHIHLIWSWNKQMTDLPNIYSLSLYIYIYCFGWVQQLSEWNASNDNRQDEPSLTCCQCQCNSSY